MESTKKTRARKSAGGDGATNAPEEAPSENKAPDMNGEEENVVEREEAPHVQQKDAQTKDEVEVKTEKSDKVEDNTPEKPKPKKRKATEKTGDESAPEENVAEAKDTQATDNTGKNSEKDDSSANESSSDLTMPPKQTLGKGKRARIPNKRYSDILLSPQSRSHKSSSSIENGDKQEKHDKNESETEEEIANIPAVTSIKSRSNTSSPAAKRTKFSTDLTNPEYLKPFHYGWKRELVYRATNDNPNKRNGDIYYYTPTGKKVRSMREVAENLKNRELSLENFTFFKEPLGLNDPEKEIIRDAKVWNKKLTLQKGGSRTPKNLSPKVQSPRVATTPKAATPKVASPKAPPPTVETPADTPSPRKASARNLGNIKNSQVKLPPTKVKIEKKAAKSDEEPMEVDTPPPAKRQAAKKTPKVATSLEVESKPCQPCSIRCQGVMGMVPTLQCRLCLCLYHYECVGLSPHVQIQAYVCKNCQLEHGQSASAPSPSIVLPPLTPINTLKSLTTQSTVLPKLQRIPRQGDSPHDQDTTPTPAEEASVVGMISQSSDVPVLPKQTAKMAIHENKSLVGSVTSWLPHSSTIQVDNVHQRNKENEPIEIPRPQYVEYLAGRKFLIIPKHNVVSVSPTVPILSKPLMKHFDVNESHGDDDKNDVNNQHGSAVLQPNNNNIENIAGVETPRTEEETDGAKDKEDQSEQVESPKAKKRATKTNSVTSTEKFEEPKFMDSYLQNLSYGYNTLLYVFQYLKVQDLLRAGCVCTMWRDIASHPSLWRTVRMKNSQVHSFEGLANSLQKHGTVHLDLRKMLLPTSSGDDIWPEFSKSIQKVQTLRKIELCRCPASVVEQLAITNKDLEVINAVTIRCESMSLDMLSSLKNLKELRLKSTSGLTLSSDITALRELINLSHLSLTSIKDLNKMDLSVIAALTNLESLDLGECTDFPSNFGEEILIKLNKLEKLRLEKGQGVCHTFEILDAVRNMPQLEQLELVNFDIKAGFDIALGGCSNIRKLLIIPTYISQSATTNHMVLGGVLRLQSTLSHFVWGVTLELLRVTELFVDQCEDPDKKDKKDKKSAGNGDSIPVLKPVPLITDKDDQIPPAHDPPQVEILPLPNLQKLLLQSLPTTRVKILKIPFHATWRQSITDTVN